MVNIPLFSEFHTCQVVGNGISEPSTVPAPSNTGLSPTIAAISEANEPASKEIIWKLGPYKLTVYKWVPSRELTYPTLGKGKSSSKCHFWWDMLVPWRVHPKKNEHGHGENHPILSIREIHFCWTRMIWIRALELGVITTLTSGVMGLPCLKLVLGAPSCGSWKLVFFPRLFFSFTWKGHFSMIKLSGQIALIP